MSSSSLQTATIPVRLWDAAIVGAGPAGTTAAIHLARQGYRTLLLDRSTFPREKVCGDGIARHAVEAMDRMGLGDRVRQEAHVITHTQIFAPERATNVTLPFHLLTLRRERYDEILAEAAVESGAAFHRADVVDVKPEEEDHVSLVLAGDSPTIRARLVFLATGRNVQLACKLGMMKTPRHTGLAVRCYVKSRAPIDRTLFSYERSAGAGYAWAFPLGHGLFNVGCGYSYRFPRETQPNLRNVLCVFMREVPPMAEIMSQATSQTPLKGAPLRYGMNSARHLVKGRVLLLGDVISATLPTSGEGIGQAQRTGEIAAQAAFRALETDDMNLLQRYPDRVQREMMPQQRHYLWIENLVAKEWLNEWGGRLSMRSPLVQRITSAVMTRELDPFRPPWR